jgi:hypothetical protein
MRKGSLNSVFGLPTILTVLIVLSVLGFASLSLLSANAEHKALQRSISLLEGSYEAESIALAYYDQLTQEYDIYSFVPIGGNMTQAITAFKFAHPDFVWNGNTFTYSKNSGIYTVTVTVTISLKHTTQDFTLLSQILSVENDQDYTQDGDPIWKGP